MKILLASMILFLGLAGCATTPVPLSQSEPGTYNPALQSALRTPTPQTGTLIIIRDSGLYCGPCKEIIYVDTQQAGYIYSSQQLTLYLTPGQHELYASTWGQSLRTSSIFTITQGKTIIMDVHLSQSGGITITPQNIDNTSTDY